MWRCINRLDYGKKYCLNSITVQENDLHAVIVRALKRFIAENESTYLTLMKATIGDAIGINGGSDEIDLLTRRVETLNKRMITLVNETIQSGGDMESNEDEFKDISEQIEQLNRRIAAIQDSLANDMSRQERLEQIQKVIEQREQNSDQYDDSIVRQMIECIKVHSDGKLTIIFGDGAEFIKKRLLGLERVGIVPNEVMPFYCHSRFPGEDVDSFRHLNHENPDAEIALIEWQPIKPVKLKENAHE